jgi:hypothetical protein
MFSDPETRAAFKKTKGAKILKGWLKLSSAEKADYQGKPKLWAGAYVKDHPGAFEPTQQQTIRTGMADFSKEYDLQEQAKVTKKEWNNVITKAATALAACIKDRTYRTADIGPNHYRYAISESLRIYYRKSIRGLSTLTFSPIKTMLLKLKKKKEDADALAESRKLDERGIRVMNKLRSQSDPDADKYNRKVYEKYLRCMQVDPRTARYNPVKNVDRDFVTTDEIRTMLRKKYRHGGVSQKSEEDIQRMTITATNILNRTPDPAGNVNALNNPSVLNEIANVANNLNNGEINNMNIENKNTDDLVLDIPLGPPPALSQGANSLPTNGLLNNAIDED